MSTWAPRSSSLALSIVLHALLLFALRSTQVVQPSFIDLSKPMPVKILPARPPRRHPAAKAVPPPRAAAPQPPPQAPPALPEPEAAKPEPPPPPPPKAIPLPEQQIVSPSESGQEVPPPDTRFLSDRDSTVPEQKMKRGEPAAGTGEDSAPQPRPARRAERPPPKAGQENGRPRQLAAVPRLDQLLPNALQLAGEGYGEPQPAKPQPEAEQAERRHARLGTGTAWLPSPGNGGTMDFLPDVREGDITLLNTKAERFAPFVRRVALRVFQNLMISMRRDLTRAAITAQEEVAMNALMSKGGDLVSMDITERSASVSLGTDRKLQQACLDGFFDRNPPPGAEGADGNYHFVLRTEVVSIADQSGRRIGYQVTFQAGLL